MQPTPAFPEIKTSSAMFKRRRWTVQPLLGVPKCARCEYGLAILLSYVSLLQCSKCDLTPLSGLPFLQELYVEGASSLESVVLDCLFPYGDMSEWQRQATNTSIAFPCLQKLEFHDMPVWKEWLGTKEGDSSFLWKLVLKHCLRLRALPHLPPGLKELILEGCQELRSLPPSS
ncbi:hypothetical protein Taro_018830 [Colocasia esculenta]|uniref:Uncharacterized protein n=1 Tax=Colocasia esculenta TaxID=4460 RepID=A0A843UXE2_COLES|nr:hypothetical protein [Colocasia esculenta]